MAVATSDRLSLSAHLLWLSSSFYLITGGVPAVQRNFGRMASFCPLLSLTSAVRLSAAPRYIRRHADTPPSATHRRAARLPPFRLRVRPKLNALLDPPQCCGSELHALRDPRRCALPIRPRDFELPPVVETRDPSETQVRPAAPRLRAARQGDAGRCWQPEHRAADVAPIWYVRLGVWLCVWRSRSPLSKVSFEHTCSAGPHPLSSCGNALCYSSAAAGPADPLA